MAIAVAIVPGRSRRDMGYTASSITLDGSYAAGGYAVTAAQLGMTSIDTLELTYNHATATNYFVPTWDRANSKIKIFKSGTANATLNECASGDITSSHSIDVVAHGAPVL